MISGMGTDKIKPTQTRINREKYNFCIIKSLEQTKKLSKRKLNAVY